MAKNVLIDDDSLPVRKMLRLYLQKFNFNILNASNGIEALEKFAQTKIDLLITDLNMPKMDGLELIRSIKADPLYKDTPTIVITTEDEETDIERAIETGADIYLVKPIIAQQLIDAANTLLK